MRQIVIRLAAAVLASTLASGFAAAQFQNASTNGAAPGKTSLPRTAATGNAPPAKPQASPMRPVLVVTTQHAGWGRVSFVLRGNPAPELRQVTDGIEARFADGTHLEAASSIHLRETGAIAIHEENGKAIASIHLLCSCIPAEQSEAGILRLDLRPGFASKTDAPARNATTIFRSDAASTPPIVANVAPNKHTDGVAKDLPVSTPQLASPAAVPETIRANARTETSQETVAKPTNVAKKDSKSRAGDAEEMNLLRAALAEKLAKLNGTPVVNHTLNSDAAASSPAMQQATSPSGQQDAAARQVCLPPVDTSEWRGEGHFNERLMSLRGPIAASQAAAEDVAVLAEYYLANGLAHEALATASEALQADASAAARQRLIRDADIARLLKGEQVSADSPLLSSPDGCTRPDATLWRNLASAAARDPEGASRDPEAAAVALRAMPEPLQRGLAFRIVSGVGNNLDALRAMAGALRNATDELPEDEARRFLLQARIAALAGDKTDYVTFLERAARDDMTVPGIIAKARLAAVRAAAGGPTAAHDEEILADAARTYRHDGPGQEAAEQYAELKLTRHDYAAALAIADETAGPRGVQTRESRGASLAVRILRVLFVEPSTALPEPDARIALFLRYGAYTTPGEKGDDIRLAAARLMLAEHMPHPALDTIKQLSDRAAATAEVARMRATAEAYAGDPAIALDLVKALPDDVASHRIAAESLRRLNQPLQAAHMLDGATGIPDRELRADLLFEAEAWKDSAAAYADLLRESALPAPMREDAGKRYALAVAMGGDPAHQALPKLPAEPVSILAAVPAASEDAQHAPPTLTSLRGALERARRTETLLGSATGHQGS